MYLKCILESVWCSHFRKMPRIVKRRCPTSWIQFFSLAANRYSFVGSMWIAIDNRRYLEILSSLQEDGFSDVISRCAQNCFSVPMTKREETQTQQNICLPEGKVWKQKTPELTIEERHKKIKKKKKPFRRYFLGAVKHVLVALSSPLTNQNAWKCSRNSNSFRVGHAT
jgi:hypothetical protein